MGWLLFAITSLAVMFAMGAILGAPWLPSRRQLIKPAFKLLNLRPGELLVDLGSGSGTILVAAARRGIRAIGYEVNPLLYGLSLWRTRKYRRLIDIKLADFWHQDLPPARGIYVFLIGRYMKRLDEKLKRELTKPTKVISLAFKIPGRTAAGQIDDLFLYRYGGREEAIEQPIV